MDPQTNQNPLPTQQTQALPAQEITTPSGPLPNASNNTNNWIWTGLIILFLIILFGLGAFFFLGHKNAGVKSVASVTPMPSGGIPQAKTTDLAPGVPDSQKTVVLVEHSDSSMEKFIIKTDLVQNYIKALPEGDRAISESPAEK